jgi:hypothetical protein
MGFVEELFFLLEEGFKVRADKRLDHIFLIHIHMSQVESQRSISKDFRDFNSSEVLAEFTASSIPRVEA